MSGKHKRPRVYISLPEEIHSLYSDFAKLTGKPLATTLSLILVEAAPIHQEIITALEESNKNADEFKKLIKDRLAIKSSEALQQSLDL